MCGRITQKTGELPGLVTMMGSGDGRVQQADARRPRYNGAPSQQFWVIRKHPETAANRTDLLTWGLIPNWTKEINPRLKPINATAERVASAPMFRAAYTKRRCIVPIDNFFEWKAVKGAMAKQPYAIGMSSGEPFGLAGIWESWTHPATGEIHRTFAVITCPANELVSRIHDRMPVILRSEGYERWLANIEPNPFDLMVPYPSALIQIWPISTRVNKPAYDDPSILAPLEVAEGGSNTLV
jgi:putative SOS response-associated peptidase YedK